MYTKSPVKRGAAASTQPHHMPTPSFLNAYPPWSVAVTCSPAMMMGLLSTPKFVLVLLILLCLYLPAAGAEYNVVDLGAKPGGIVDADKPLLRAWASACASTKPGTIRVPKGRFLLSPVVFKGPCKNRAIKFLIEGTLLAPASFGSSEYWIRFDGVDGVSVQGGTLDGRGSRLWACKTAGGKCPRGDISLTISGSKNVRISGVTSVDSKLFHIWINGCDGVEVDAVKLIAPDDSPNTDGIHVQMSKGVTVTRSTITTGDDCISVGPGTTALHVERVFCGPGHGISIGSLGNNRQEPGVENVTVKAVVLNGTDNGLRVKTWARESNGFVRDVLFDDAIMRNVKNPIIVDQNYCPSRKGCPNMNSGIKISNVKYKNVRGSSATPVAVKFDCSPSNPCTGMRLHNVNLKYQNRPAQAYCKHARGASTGVAIPSSCF